MPARQGAGVGVAPKRVVWALAPVPPAAIALYAQVDGYHHEYRGSVSCGVPRRGVGRNHIKTRRPVFGKRPVPKTDALLAGNEVNAVYGARLYTQVASGAFVSNDGMHDLCGTENGVYRAGLDAFCAANTFILSDQCYNRLFLHAVLSVQRLGLNVQQIGQRLNGLFTTGWALVDRIAIGDRLGIGSAPRITTLAALRLRLQRIDLITDGVPFDAKANGGKAQQRTENGAES